MAEDTGTLSVATQTVPASTAVTVMSLEIVRPLSRLFIIYRVGSGPPRRTFVQLGAPAMVTINTAITTAISADLPGNPGVVLP